MRLAWSGMRGTIRPTGNGCRPMSGAVPSGPWTTRSHSCSPSTARSLSSPARPPASARASPPSWRRPGPRRRDGHRRRWSGEGGDGHRAGHRADGPLDVTDEASAWAGITAAVESGGLDILVNNAGSYHDAGSIVDQTYDSWRRAIAINYEGVFLCSKPAAEHMVARGAGGAIVTISSVDGIVPCLGTGYDSAKAALFQFTRSLAVDLAPFGIRANCVAGERSGRDDPADEVRRAAEAVGRAVGANGPDGPDGDVPLVQHPARAQGRPEEISHAVLYLCSRAAPYVTGQTLVVDGGWTLV